MTAKFSNYSDVIKSLQPQDRLLPETHGNDAAVNEAGDAYFQSLIINNDTTLQGLTAGITVLGSLTVNGVEITRNGQDIANLPTANGVLYVNDGALSNKASFVFNPITELLSCNALNASGNITGLTLTGTLSTADQSNITSIGALMGLTMNGNIDMGTNNIISSGSIGGTLSTSAQTNITSIGTLSNLTVTNAITAGSVSALTLSGALSTGSQTNITSIGTLSNLTVTNAITAGSVSALTLSGTNLTGLLSTAAQTNITSVGTLEGLNVAGTGLISANSNTTTALEIRQLGTADCFRIEDSTNPDLTALRIDNAGNLGIGVASATTLTNKLELVGNMSITGGIGATGASTFTSFNFTNPVAGDNYILMTAGIVSGARSDRFLRFRTGSNPVSSAGICLSSYDSNHTRLYQYNEYMVFSTSTTISTNPAAANFTNRIILDSTTGNLCIGSTTPTARLEIVDTTKDSVALLIRCALSGETADHIFRVSNVNSSGLLQMQSRFQNGSSTYAIQIHTEGDSYFNGGNVGIGTATPTSKLDVAGDIKASGNIFGQFYGFICYFMKKSSTRSYEMIPEYASILNPQLYGFLGTGNRYVDRTGGITTSSMAFICPKTGFWDFKLVGHGGETSGRIITVINTIASATTPILSTNSNYEMHDYTTGTTTDNINVFSGIIQMAAGDSIQFKAHSSVGGMYEYVFFTGSYLGV